VSRDAPLDQLEVGLLGSLGWRSRRRLAEHVSVQELRAGERVLRRIGRGEIAVSSRC
jgi:hypothetical protein